MEGLDEIADPDDKRGLPRVLVMTMVRDEAEMLPRWVRHYAAQVGMENLLVLDDNSTDGSTDDLECTVHLVPPLPGSNFEGVRMDLVSGLAQGFLKVYDYVVFVDADEFLVPDPTKHATLPDFLAARPDADVVAPVALNVLHLPTQEGPLRPDLPVLDQRRFAKFAPLMCKPAIKRIPAKWKFGSHGIKAPYAVDPELYMLHLKFADREALRAVAAHRQALVQLDGRGKKSSWRTDIENVLTIIDDSFAGIDLDRVPEFDPSPDRLRAVVRRRDDYYRSGNRWQIGTLKHQPLRRVPTRLIGTI